MKKAKAVNRICIKSGLSGAGFRIDGGVVDINFILRIAVISLLRKAVDTRL